MYIGGVIVYAGALACFIYFLITGYEEATKEFMSVNKGDGICEAVARENDGNYRATNEGFWEGTPAYTPSLAKFEIDFYGLAITSDEYKELIRYFRKEVEKVGKGALTRDAAYNLMYWISYEIQSPLFQFQFTGSNRYTFINSLHIMTHIT